MKIGFIGLGIMGIRMAANLQAAGHSLVVYNRTRSKAGPLVEKGAVWAGSPAELAPQVEVLFTMLADPAAVEAVALGPNGFLDRMEAGAIWVDCSTVNPSFSRKMAEAARERGARLVEAPVAGTRGPAEAGTLQVFASGDRAAVETCAPLFEIIGRGYTYMGDSGNAASMKMVVNLLLGQAMVAFSEALVLGQSLGLDRAMLLDALIGGPVAAPFVKGKRPKIEQADYEADFPLRLMRKDLHLAAASGYEQGVALPAANAAKEIYALAELCGLGDQDFSAVYKFLNGEAA